MSEETSSGREKFLEYFTAVLLGLTTTLGAVAAYYNSLWSGSSNESFVKSIMTMNDANSTALAGFSKQTEIKLDRITDDIYYVEWKRAHWNKDPDTAYFFSKLSPESQADIRGGITQLDCTYVFQKMREDTLYIDRINMLADSVSDEATKQIGLAQAEGKHGDDFTLITVLYTVVLFFAGFASLRSSMRMRLIYIVCATLVFTGTTILFFTLPFPSA